MKKLLAILLAASSISAGFGCTMCAHPNDYCYAVYDEAHAYGHRAGSAFSPVSTSSSGEMTTVLETVNSDSVIDEEYYEVESSQP